MKKDRATLGMTQNIVSKVRITKEHARKADDTLSKRELVSLVCVMSAKRPAGNSFRDPRASCDRQNFDQAGLQPRLLHLLALLSSSLLFSLSFSPSHFSSARYGTMINTNIEWLHMAMLLFAPPQLQVTKRMELMPLCLGVRNLVNWLVWCEILSLELNRIPR